MPLDTAKYLENFGWKKGKGLGKNEQGNAEALRVKKKDDTVGVSSPPNPALRTPKSLLTLRRFSFIRSA